MDFSQVQHVVQGQHSRRSLRKVHCWVDMVLEEKISDLRLGRLSVCGVT